MKKRIQERRARNLELGKADAKNRCTFCRRALPKTGSVSRWPDNKRFCNEDCIADFEEREALTR